MLSRTMRKSLSDALASSPDNHIPCSPAIFLGEKQPKRVTGANNNVRKKDDLGPSPCTRHRPSTATMVSSVIRWRVRWWSDRFTEAMSRHISPDQKGLESKSFNLEEVEDGRKDSKVRSCLEWMAIEGASAVEERTQQTAYI